MLVLLFLAGLGLITTGAVILTWSAWPLIVAGAVLLAIFAFIAWAITPPAPSTRRRRRRRGGGRP